MAGGTAAPVITHCCVSISAKSLGNQISTRSYALAKIQNPLTMLLAPTPYNTPKLPSQNTLYENAHASHISSPTTPTFFESVPLLSSDHTVLSLSPEIGTQVLPTQICSIVAAVTVARRQMPREATRPAN
jgi:hypothetical protein